MLTFRCVNRLTDLGAIEGRLLELAHTTDAKLTAPALAYFAPCSLEDANRVLDDLAARDRLTMEIEDDGTVLYHLLGRQRFAAPPSPTSAAGRATSPLQPALVRVAHAPYGPSPALAGVLGALVPGAGHLYAGQLGAAVMWFVVVTLGYVLLLPGLLLHLFSIASAAVTARRVETRTRLSLAGAP